MRSYLAAFFLLLAFPAFSQDTLSNQTGLSETERTEISREVPEQTGLEFRNKQVPKLQVIARSVFIASVGSGVGLATYSMVDMPLRDFTLANRTHETSEITRYIEPFGNSKYMIPASALVYASGLALRNPNLQRAGLLITSSMLINDYVTKVLKNEFQRRRPDQADHHSYFEGGEGGRHYASFPSSHTSTAFAFATSVATVYKDHKWVPPVAYAGATLVGLSRIHDNKHWATDVMAGAAVGFLTAKATHFLLQQTEKQLEKRNIYIYVGPRISAETAGVNLGLTF